MGTQISEVWPGRSQ